MPIKRRLSGEDTRLSQWAEEIRKRLAKRLSNKDAQLDACDNTIERLQGLGEDQSYRVILWQRVRAMIESEP